MGNSSSAEPTFRIELNQSRWLAGETISGRVIIEESSKKGRSNVPKIQSLRIQFRGEERVSMEVSRVVQRTESAGRSMESSTMGTRRTDTSVSRSHEESSSLREPLLDRGYARVTIESDQATSGPPPSRRGRQHGENGRQRSPIRHERPQRAAVESPNVNNRRSHDSNGPARNDHHRTPLEDPRRSRNSNRSHERSESGRGHRAALGSEPRFASSNRGQRTLSPVRNHLSSGNGAGQRESVNADTRPRQHTARDHVHSPTIPRAERNVRIDSGTSRRDARSQAQAQRREALERSATLRREQRARRRHHRSQPPPPVVAPVEANQRPELAHRPSYREEYYTDNATHTIFEADSLLVQLDGEDASYYPFGWTLPSDAPSSFRWKNGASSAQIDYAVIIYAVTDSGDTVGRTKHPFVVDAQSSPELLLAEPQDLPVLGCCSNKGVIRMELRGPSNTAVAGHRFPVDVDVDSSACRRSVVNCQVVLSETVRIRTSNGSEKRFSNQPIHLNTTRYNSTVGLSVPSNTLPTYHGRWVDIQHELSVTAVTAGCCTNNPEITTAVMVATKASPSSPSSVAPTASTNGIASATSDQPASVDIASPPMATVIPEATVVTVVSDEEETTDDKALSQPPDTSRQFHPTAPDESMVV